MKERISPSAFFNRRLDLSYNGMEFCPTCLNDVIKTFCENARSCMKLALQVGQVQESFSYPQGQFVSQSVDT